jgi:hypothetical protein
MKVICVVLSLFLTAEKYIKIFNLHIYYSGQRVGCNNVFHLRSYHTAYTVCDRSYH